VVARVAVAALLARSEVQQLVADALTDAGTGKPMRLALLEAPRALTEASTLIPSRTFLKSLGRGDGHAVMTLPGFLATDRSTRVLRQYCHEWGYDPWPWDQGRNAQEMMIARLRGKPKPLREIKADLPPRLEAVLGKAMSLDPGDRFPGMTAFAEALEGAEESGVFAKLFKK